MDIKIQGISFEIFEKALPKRMSAEHILGIMEDDHRPCRSPTSPVRPAIDNGQIPTEMIVRSSDGRKDDRQM